MIADRVRTEAYAGALRAAVRPGSTVLDLGAGTGIFSLLACQQGARRVYAIESSDAIEVARRIALANGYADRIEFIQGASAEIKLAEKVDVIVSDVHGTQPFLRTNIVSIIDARRRMLADGGVLIPQRETLWAAVVEAPEEYDQLVSPWATGNFSLDMDAARHAATNSIKKATVKPDQLFAEAQCWGVLDYANIEQPSHAGAISFAAGRTGVAHGLILWFDSVLAKGIGFSNAPGEPELVYSSSFFPWSVPVQLQAGDKIEVRLRADYTGADYTWSWDSKVSSGDPVRTKAEFRQSTFWGSPLSATRLRRRAGGHRPVLGEAGQLDGFILGRIDGAASLDEIARSVMQRFPGRFHSLGEALARVGDLSDTYGEAADRGLTP